MQIQITFAESAGYTFESIDNFIRIDDSGNKFFSVIGIADIIGEELEKVLCEDYFQGAELAVKYKDYSLDIECFFFEIMPC